MRLLIKLTLLIGVCIPLGTGCGQEFKGGQLVGSDTVSHSSRKRESFGNVVRSAKAVTLYEGLPHQTWERDALEKELASKVTVSLHDFPFYKEPLQLSEKDEQALSEIMCSDDTFAPFRGEKMCGGFHPDYCIEWRGNDGKAYRVLICFGCHEAKLCVPRREVRHDVNKPAFDQIETILKPYRKNRPTK